MILEWNIPHRVDLYVHPKNSTHLRSHSRAITALDHSRLGLENKSGRFAFDKFTLQNLANLLYFLYITSEVKRYYEALYLSYRPRTDCSLSLFFKTNCTQSIFRTINRWLLEKPFKNFQNHLYASRFSLLTSGRVCKWTLIGLHFNIITNLICYFSYLMAL